MSKTITTFAEDQNLIKAMKLTASYMCALAVALMFSLQMSAQDGTVVSIVTESLLHGRAEQLSERMHEEIELTVREKGYSGKEKSGKALTRFLSENAPEDFDVLHTGERENSVFVIGNLGTDKGSFRIYFLVKDNLIYQMRIENND